MTGVGNAMITQECIVHSCVDKSKMEKTRFVDTWVFFRYSLVTSFKFSGLIGTLLIKYGDIATFII